MQVRDYAVQRADLRSAEPVLLLRRGKTDRAERTRPGNRQQREGAEAAAADYIAAEMESYGLEVEVQEFPIIYFEELSSPELEQIFPFPTAYQVDTDFATMDYSGSGDVTSELQAVDLDLPPTGNSTSGCEASDFVGFTPGKIALIQRGECYYSTKAMNAQDAGAVGVIIFNEGNTPGRVPLMYGTLGGPGINIPVQSTSHNLGVELDNLPGIVEELHLAAIYSYPDLYVLTHRFFRSPLRKTRDAETGPG